MRTTVLVAIVAAVLVIALPTSHAFTSGIARRKEARLAALRQYTDAAALPTVMPPPHFHAVAVDHFDAQNRATYKQRYYVNTTFWTQPDGPVFLYIEGEAAANPLDVVVGEHMELAAKYGALVFAVEHRYYGASIPVPSLSTPNMRFLSSQQALADLAQFYRFASNKYKLTAANKVIAFGGSYPGALSAWSRTKYSSYIYASVASSAPVHAMNNFVLYNDVVDASLSATIVGGSPQCAANMKAAFTTIDKMIATQSGLTAITKEFDTCEPVTTANDTLTFVSNLSNNIQETVQYNAEIPGAATIAQVCSFMTNTANDPVTNLVALTKQLYSHGECMDNSYLSSNADLFNTTANPASTGVGIRQWIYQSCTQFGYWQTCDPGTNCVFSNLQTLLSNTDLCYDAFGIMADEIPTRVNFTNDYYGATTPGGTRVTFVNGSIDPWHSLSVLTNLTATVTAVFIDGTAHCANMMPSTPNDPPQLVAAREKISNQVGQWLSE